MEMEINILDFRRKK